MRKENRAPEHERRTDRGGHHAAFSTVIREEKGVFLNSIEDEAAKSTSGERDDESPSRMNDANITATGSSDVQGHRAPAPPNYPPPLNNSLEKQEFSWTGINARSQISQFLKDATPSHDGATLTGLHVRARLAEAVRSLLQGANGSV